MRSILIVMLLTFNSNAGHAQNWKTDLALLKGEESRTVEKKIASKTRSNLAYFLYQSSIGFYQKHISAQIGANCIYEVTCSRFSRQLVDEFGVVKGVFMSLDRVGRCNKLAYMETLPARINFSGKVMEHLDDYHLH